MQKYIHINLFGIEDFSVEISVIMSVYNTKPDYLSEAIDSILRQSYENFEFLIINDGTTNKETLDTLKKYKERDSRIRLIVNETNIGLTKSLNIGLKTAKGKYVARMDSDDISYNHRLEKQYIYMEQNQDIDVLGCLIRKIGKAQTVEPSNYIDFTQNDYESFIIKMLFYNVGPIHPTVMIRNNFLKKHNIKYDESIKKAQDYALWMECISAGGKIKNLPKVLLEYRLHNAQITVMDNSEQIACMQNTSIQNLKRLGFKMDEREYKMLVTLYAPEYNANPKCYIDALNKLSLLNQQINRFPVIKFNTEIKIRWIHKVVKCIVKKHDFSGVFHCYTYQCIFSKALLIWFKDHVFKSICQKLYSKRNSSYEFYSNKEK